MAQLFGWGKANTGALGVEGSDLTLVTSPHYIKEFTSNEVIHISSSAGHTLLTLEGGKVLSCGENDFNQCGRDSKLRKLLPIEAALKPHVLKACAGTSHSVALTDAQELFTWGKNDEGQLGRGDIPEESAICPKLLKTLASYSVIQVSCGNSHSIVLTSDGQLASWGSNSYGQIGNGIKSSNGHNTPFFIKCLNGLPVKQVVAGGNHTCVLSPSGAVYGWGRNTFGQLGLNDNVDKPVPTVCRPLRSQKIKFISCGENHTAALTIDGRVFTFGSGSYGQLGHNSLNAETFPRQVMELSGNHVSQVVCGREHTLAFVMSLNRVYAFGLGGSGQLGLSSTTNKSSPFVVQGPWGADEGGAPSNTVTPMRVDGNGPGIKINCIYSGGDYSFVTCQNANNFRPSHCYENPRAQILTLSQELLKELRPLKSSDTPPHDVAEKVSKIFSSASCINGSFLLPEEALHSMGNRVSFLTQYRVEYCLVRVYSNELGDDHYGSSRRKHGLNMVAVREFFQELASVDNVIIMQKISNSLELELIPKLPNTPPDVEALRVYLILPECHLMDNPKCYSSIICPFAKSLLSLNKVALETFDLWWETNQPSFFNRLVTIYKHCIEHLLQLPDTSNPLEVRKRQAGLHTSMEMLQKLNQVNEDQNQIIPCHKFYVPELKDKVNIRNDYISWVQQTTQQHQVGGLLAQGLYFCNYPFLFDGAAKSVLLQTDAAMQMQNAIENAQRRNLVGFFSGLTSQQLFDPVNPCLVLVISRKNLVQDALIQLQNKHSGDLKKPLKVVFVGEEAVDEGGVRKEFFMLLLREAMDPKYGMFNTHDQSNLLWFNPMSFDGPGMFRMIGILCGLAIYNFTIIDLPFPLALFKKLLKKPVNLDDLKELKPEVGKGLQDLLDYEEDDFEDVFTLSFEIMREHFGETTARELCPDGANTTVNKSNRQEYVNLYVDDVLNVSVRSQFEAFSEGFHSVCGGRVLELFHPQELQAMVIGNEDYDFEELEKNTEYKGVFHRNHPTIQFFWEVFRSMSLADKKKFLLFLTGSYRIPVFGMKYLKMIIQSTNGGQDFLPVAHTCFNILDLPQYNSKETLENKLLTAIQQTEGFGLV